MSPRCDDRGMIHSRVALVTGSTRGLGAAIARRLGREGRAVAVNGLPDRLPSGDDVVADIRSAGGTAALFDADVEWTRPASAVS